MRAIIIGLGLALIASATAAQVGDHYVNGYTRSNGTYVAPHYQTNPNATRDDNYSTRGNVNPYTGVEGTKPRDGEAPAYRSPQYYAKPMGQSSFGQVPSNSSFATQ